jgi:hypothetical protein
MVNALGQLATLNANDLCVGTEPYEDSVYVVPAQYFLDGIQAYTAILEATTFGELEDRLPASCRSAVMAYVTRWWQGGMPQGAPTRATPYSPRDYRGLSEYFDHQGHGLVEPVLAATLIQAGEEFAYPSTGDEAWENEAKPTDHASLELSDEDDAEEEYDGDDGDEEQYEVYVATAAQGLSQTFITLPSDALEAVRADYRQMGFELVDSDKLLEHMYALYERLP